MGGVSCAKKDEKRPEKIRRQSCEPFGRAQRRGGGDSVSEWLPRLRRGDRILSGRRGLLELLAGSRTEDPERGLLREVLRAAAIARIGHRATH